MSFAQSGNAFDTGAAEPVAAPEENPFYPILDSIVARLGDNLDHPELWPMLADAAAHDDVAMLRDLIAQVRPGQGGSVGKALDVVAGVLHALSVDRAEGLAALSRLAANHAHCPMVAGAYFFVDRIGTPGRSADLSDRFCDAPFIKFETLMDGTVAPCCSIWTQKRLGTLDGQTAEEIWNSPSSQQMRESILDGSYRYCNKQRCTLIMEDQLPRRDAVADPGLRAIIDAGQTALDTPPRWLFLAHDVSCNLACPSCRSEILGASEAQEARFAKIEQQVFQPLLSAGGRVKISLSGQGDPWSAPHYRSILRYLADHELDVDLDLHTNALLMGEKRWQEYAGLDRYEALVNVSIDACTPWVYEVVRRPGKWEKLYPNLRFIADKHDRGEFREFHLNATIQLDNFHEMPAFIDLAEELGADSFRMYMMQNTGGHIARDYARKNVGDVQHPLHRAFLETLRDPRLADPRAHLYDVGTWRARALEARLPTDALGAGYGFAALSDAIRDADGDDATIVALCAGGRTRLRGNVDLLLVEASALRRLGFEQQAEYRLREREALGGEAVALG
ncbi:SPASM domain-containing protein [Sphingosinithalassobacter portus]|uniref:SPASM domain-containing protein n=1 Tax=Stakelama portus TaxID=2676234 RepID=UPI000D6E19C9|nr:SPASM domain-containing protein [Sphingosinithalassobacter portus]